MPTGDRISPNLDSVVDPARVRFGSFEYDTTTGELRREGMRTHLQAQPAKVLSHLVFHAGETVSRDDLHNAIWSDETFVDFERGLNVCIAQIRSVLGDESTSPRYIRTVPRRGYQFICPVERIAEAAPSAPDEKAGRLKNPRRILFAAVGLVLAIIVIVIVANWRQIVPGFPSPVVVAVAEFDNETGDPGLTSFCRSLTDNVIQQLTFAGQNHFVVIGNAVPREQRDLRHVANSLGAQYIVLGHVQGGGTQTRILAHLIHMPDQTPVWVVRLEQPFEDPFTLESTAARDIAMEFARKLE